MRLTADLKRKMAVNVARGVRWLDKEHPAWYNNVDLRSLDMEAGGHCILGQCFGEFWAALDKFKKPGDNKWAARHGFNVPGADVDRVPNGAYEYLGLLWAPPVATRQVKAAQPVEES